MSSSQSSGSRPSKSSAEVIAAVLAGAADAVRSLSDDDIAAFLAGQRDLTIRAGRRPARRPKRQLSDEQANDVRVALGAMNTRDEGIAYLERLDLNRDALRALVAALDLPAMRSDNIQRLRERIVESLIGYRLRSQAIRGGRVGVDETVKGEKRSKSVQSGRARESAASGGSSAKARSSHGRVPDG